MTAWFTQQKMNNAVHGYLRKNKSAEEIAAPSDGESELCVVLTFSLPYMTEISVVIRQWT